jgi:hypothetical protein
MDENALEPMHRMIDVDNIISKREVRHRNTVTDTNKTQCVFFIKLVQSHVDT